MNRDKALTIADRIMTRIETDKAVHKDAIADEIQAGDALDDIVDIITVDGGKMTHRDGTPFNRDADKHPDYVEHVRRSQAESATDIVMLHKAFERRLMTILQAWSKPLALDIDDRDTP